METKDKILSLKEQLKALKSDERSLSIKKNTNKKNQQVIKRELWHLNTGIQMGDDVSFIESGMRKRTKAVLVGLDVGGMNVVYPIVQIYNNHHKTINRERLISLDEQKSLEKI